MCRPADRRSLGFHAALMGDASSFIEVSLNRVSGTHHEVTLSNTKTAGMPKFGGRMCIPNYGCDNHTHSYRYMPTHASCAHAEPSKRCSEKSWNTFRNNPTAKEADAFMFCFPPSDVRQFLHFNKAGGSRGGICTPGCVYARARARACVFFGGNADRARCGRGCLRVAIDPPTSTSCVATRRPDDRHELSPQPRHWRSGRLGGDVAARARARARTRQGQLSRHLLRLSELAEHACVVRLRATASHDAHLYTHTKMCTRAP